MTRLNLAQTCLMDASGELGKKAAAQLQEHTAQFPAALLEYELVRSQFEMLRSMPKVELSDTEKRQIADAIKRKIHRKLSAQDRTRRTAFRLRFAYRALAGITSIAACLVIAAAVYLVNQDAQHREADRIARATESVSDYLASDTTSSQTDQDVNGVQSEISDYAAGATPLASQSDGMMRLIDALSSVPKQNTSPAAAPGI